MTTLELLKNKDLGKIAKEGARIYQKIKSKYEPRHKGDFLAIDTESKDVFLASTSAEAVVKAKVKHPEKIFFVVKIGFDAAETIAHYFYKK